MLLLDLALHADITCYAFEQTLCPTRSPYEKRIWFTVWTYLRATTTLGEAYLSLPHIGYSPWSEALHRLNEAILEVYDWQPDEFPPCLCFPGRFE